MDLHLSISNGFVSSKIYDKRDDLDLDIVNFPFMDGNVPRRPSTHILINKTGVYMYMYIYFIFLTFVLKYKCVVTSIHFLWFEQKI